MALLVPMIWAVLAQQPMIPLRGVVSDADGRPVAGAEVFLMGVPRWLDAALISRGKTDDAGMFTIDRPRNLMGEGFFYAPAVWILPPGGRITVKKFPASLPAEAESIRLETRPATRTEVHIENSGGDPVAGARVRVVRVHTASSTVPDAILNRTERSTDAQGVAWLDAFAPEDVAGLEVQAEGFGIQFPGYSLPGIGPKRVVLRPVGSVAGRLAGDDPALVKGWKVSMQTRLDPTTATGFGTMGHGVATVDAAGRFALPAIAEGQLDFYINWPDDTTVLPAFSDP